MRLFRIRLPPEWGTDPVPREHRRLRGADLLVLWFSLGIGLLVLAAGAVLTKAPANFGFGLTLTEAAVVAVLGSVVGSAMLALAGHLGAVHGVPTMVGLRAILGRHGSYVATALNVFQLVGWAAFEVMIMGEAAARIVGQEASSATAMGLVILFGLFCTILALGGPVAVVRAWLERFAVWLVIASTAWITYGVFAGGVGSWGGFASQPAAILLGLDLVIAMPVSWWPLVCDYNRFGAQPRGASGGTFLGYAIANAWFFLLGAAMIVLLGATDVIASILSLSLGGVVLLLILVDETDNGFANLYSGAVSLQNLRPRSGQRRFVMAVAIVSIAIGVILAAGGGFNGPATLAYEGFLLLIGGAFVPLLGVLTTDAFVVRRRAAYRPEEFGQMSPTIRWESLAAWGTGAAAYFYLWWTNYGGGVGWPTLTIGLSLPAFAIACTIQYVLTRWAVPAAAGTRTVP